MHTLHSIAPIQTYYKTLGSAPVLVLCNDFKQYICKYADRETSALVREYVASRFLQIWEVPTPKPVWVRVKQAHNEQKTLIADKYFQKNCFGSEYLHDVIDVDFS
ncbi:MAG: hypothetical protein RLZZ312_66, partial [Bacteroidota bacterium]